MANFTLKKSHVLAIAGTVLAIILCLSCCTVVDSSEVGIKFKKFALTEQGGHSCQRMDLLQPDNHCRIYISCLYPES